METVLQKAIKSLGSGLLDTEARVKLAVIVPILRGLGWDYRNPKEFVPEYAVRNVAAGRVDYALLEPGGRARVFIEAKKLGRVDEAGEKQLFKYAANKGVPLLVLTDGDVWDFYLSMAEGPPTERRFYRAVLTSGKVTEYATSFERFLSKASVCSGDARIAAEKQHDDRQKKEQARLAIPTGWQTLLERRDPDLRGMLATAVENECGTAPEQDDLDKFLGDQLRLTSDHGSVIYPDDSFNKNKKKKIGAATPTTQPLVGYILDGQRHVIGSAAGTFKAILKEFHRRDPIFMSRFADKTVGSRHRLVAQRREDLPTDGPRAKNITDLNNGWLISIHHNTGQLCTFIKLACELVGVTFNIQLKLISRDD